MIIKLKKENGYGEDNRYSERELSRIMELDFIVDLLHYEISEISEKQFNIVYFWRLRESS